MLRRFPSTFLGAVRARIIARPRAFVALLMGFAALAWAAAIATVWLSLGLIRGLPAKEGLLTIGNMSQATTLFDMENRPVFAIFKEQRIEVPLEQVSPTLIRAILTVEDQRFFEHRGVDIVRVVAAAWANVRDGWATQGGSTITQQLARQAFLSGHKTLRRKLTETILAARLERMYSKREILELYLNKIYFGDGLYGVQAASLGYFAKPASELEVAEAAVLAGVVKSPSVYAPTISMARAVTRRNVVLKTMLSTGAISPAEYDRARRTPLHIRNGLNQHESFGLYFKEYVRQELVERFGWDRVYEGGLRVFTTLDTGAQTAAEEILERGAKALESRRSKWRARSARNARPDQPVEAALLAVDPTTGFIRAMVGGRDFWRS
ncbi:MAG: transglycosylase domain-containing protein [Acidobacteria bacterium]|nr:transglycosylase domain-containing protein [Acidobacteriota bacterium]